MEQTIDRKLINWTRIKLLLQCFGVSGVTVLIALPLFKDIFYVEAEKMLIVGLGVLLTLSTTGIAQLLFNEKWFTPIARFLEIHIVKEAVQKDTSSPPLRTAGIMFSFWVAVIVISTIVLSYLGDLPLSHYLIFGVVSLLIGLGFSFLWYRILRQRSEFSSEDWDAARDAVEAGKALMAFPLRSARLSFFLWTYAGVAFGLVFYYLASISRIQSFYIFSIAVCAGALAFPLQYFLFKRSLSIFTDTITTMGGELLLQENLFRISTKSKLLVSFITLITFTITIPGVVNYSKTAEIIKQRVAKMGERHLRFLSEKLKGRQIEIPSEWDSLKREIARLEEGEEGSSFILDQSGDILLGSLPETFKKKYLQEMIQKK